MVTVKAILIGLVSMVSTYTVAASVQHYELTHPHPLKIDTSHVKNYDK